jgi:DNA-binding response OmpR family regulator
MMQTTILLIEDNQDIQENTAELLELQGYRVLSAFNGQEGIILAETYLPDLIISDVVMPEGDGYAVFNALRENAATWDIPVIFISAKSENADRLKALGMGVCDYLVKPFDEQELFDCIEKRLNRWPDQKTT